MPKNNNLPPVKLPMPIRFGEKPTTEFKNNLDSIKVTLTGAPTMEQIRSFLPEFLEATWADEATSCRSLTNSEKDEIIINCLKGKALPTALETIRLTFKIEGISLQEVTHILRYRTASFSADCSGDKWWTHKAALIPNSIQNSNGSNEERMIEGLNNVPYEDNFCDRYKQIVQMAKELYCDLINSKKVSIMDARYILPRCLETFYFMSISLKDAIHFIKQRIDKQIQPETDNLIAYYMYIELLKRYPVMKNIINIHAPSGFYVAMARTGKATNLYYPDEDSDKFEWNEKDFIYQCKRDEMNGTDKDATNYFNELLKRIDFTIEALNKMPREDK